MGIYIFPIFLFGCAVTGIVFLGIQQARDWAKAELAVRRESDSYAKTTTVRSTETELKLPGN